MKKILAMALALVMALSLAACGGGNDTKPQSGNNDTPTPSSTNDPGTSQQVQQSSDSEQEQTNPDGENAGDEATIADGWEIPEYPHGELVHTEYDESGVATAFYFNNTTIDECHEYCLALESAGYMEMTNHDIHEDPDGLGNSILYNAMHPSSYVVYEVDYGYDKMEHTADTPDGEVAYQLVIRNKGK